MDTVGHADGQRHICIMKLFVSEHVATYKSKNLLLYSFSHCTTVVVQQLLVTINVHIHFWNSAWWEIPISVVVSVLIVNLDLANSEKVNFVSTMFQERWKLYCETFMSNVIFLQMDLVIIWSNILQLLKKEKILTRRS